MVTFFFFAWHFIFPFFIHSFHWERLRLAPVDSQAFPHSFFRCQDKVHLYLRRRGMWRWMWRSVWNVLANGHEAGIKQNSRNISHNYPILCRLLENPSPTHTSHSFFPFTSSEELLLIFRRCNQSFFPTLLTAICQSFTGLLPFELSRTEVKHHLFIQSQSWLWYPRLV